MNKGMQRMLEETHTRTFNIETRADDNSGLIEIAFSSEEPYERYFGSEVLSHDPQSVMLDRLNGGAAVLVNHDSSDQVGVVDSARVDDDKRGRAAIRFSQSVRGQEIMQDVKDGIRQLVSVGYRINKYEVTEREGQSDLVKVTNWEPYEVSLVAIPADTTVGVGRSAEETKATETQIQTTQEVKTMTDKTEVKTEALAFDADAERTKLRTEETRRRTAIDAIADKYELSEMGKQAVSEGWSVQIFNEKALEKVGERNNAIRAESTHDGELDLSVSESGRFSLVKLMDALANPNDRAAQDRAGLELEVSAEALRGFGGDFKCRGSFVPESLLSGDKRDLSAGTATDGAELVADNLLSSSYIDVLRNASSAMRAGVTVLPGLVGNVDIPRQTSAAAATWISAEGGDATESEPQFDQVSLTPKDLACFTETTRRLRQQSAPAIEGIIRNDLALAQALGIDAAVLYGSGSSGQPTGIANQTGINVKDLAAADPTYAELVAIVALVMADNAITGNPAWLIEANGWEALSTTPKQGSGVEGNFILNESGRIVGHPHFVSNQVTDEQYFFGDFSQVLLGEWGGMEINVDPYTKALSGTVRYVMFKTCDIAVRYPTAFCHAHDGIA